jgi:hypothetical protein
MESNTERNSPKNRARRHFFGVAAAIGAAAAGTISSSPARAMGSKWWKKGGRDGSGGSEGQNCFLRGTSIMTSRGEARIEDLKIGDLVETVRGKAAAVKWIGRHHYKKSGSSWHESVIPIRVSRHALDERTPHRDLYLSPNHALLIDGVLIRVKELVNGVSIAPELPADGNVIEYFQIVLDTHEVIVAEGAFAETFLNRGSNYEHFTNFAEYKRLYPAEPPLAMLPFAPSVGYEGGRAHLKALLRLGVSPFVQVHDPIQFAYEKIAQRASQLAN